MLAPLVELVLQAQALLVRFDGADRLDENNAAAAIALTPEDLRAIESAASRITIQGARYPEHLEKRTGL